MIRKATRILTALALLATTGCESCMIREDQDDGLNPEPAGEYGKPERILENVRKLGEDVPDAVLREVIRQLCIAEKYAEPYLVKALEDENPRRRANAVFVLGGFTSLDLVKHIAAKLKDKDPRVVLEAATSMCEKGHKEYIPTIIAALRSDNPVIRERSNVNLMVFTGQDFGFKAYDPIDRREYSIRKWEQWWAANADTVDLRSSR